MRGSSGWYRKLKDTCCIVLRKVNWFGEKWQWRKNIWRLSFTSWKVFELKLLLFLNKVLKWTFTGSFLFTLQSKYWNELQFYTHFPNVRGPASVVHCYSWDSCVLVLQQSGGYWPQLEQPDGEKRGWGTERERERQRGKKCSDGKWKNEIMRRENETEKPGEQFLYQDPQNHDPVRARIQQAQGLVHNVSLMLYQTSATAGPGRQIKSPLRRLVPVVCLDFHGGTVRFLCLLSAVKCNIWSQLLSHPEVTNPTGPKWHLITAHKPAQLQNTVSGVITWNWKIMFIFCEMCTICICTALKNNTTTINSWQGQSGAETFLRRCFDGELWVKRRGSFESSSAVNKISANTTSPLCHTVFARTHLHRQCLGFSLSLSLSLTHTHTLSLSLLSLRHTHTCTLTHICTRKTVGHWQQWRISKFIYSISLQGGKIHKQKPIDRLKVSRVQGHIFFLIIVGLEWVAKGEK